MAPFDQLNIIIASVVGGVALLYIIFASIIHHSFKVRLQSGDGLEVYRDTAKRKETSALDNRKRIYYTTEPCNLIVNQYNQFEEQRSSDQIKYFSFVSRKKALLGRRILRFIAVILFILAFLVVLVSAALILAEFFTQEDLITIGFFASIPELVKFLMSYNTLMVAFGVLLISFVTMKLISSSIRTYRICEPFYLEKLNIDEANRAFEPVRIKVKAQCQN